MRIQLQPAYLLHRRPYRDNSELLDVLTAEHGRLGAVARGLARRRSGGALGAVLQPFRPLLLSLSGRGELLTLTAVEVGGELGSLGGDGLFSGFYLNELLLRLLQRFEACPGVFVAYGEALAALAAAADGAALALALRRFEFSLLGELGYAVDLERTADTGAPVTADGLYRVIADTGVIAIPPGIGEGDGDAIAGADLLAISTGRLEAVKGRVAKRLARSLLRAHLGPEPLRSQRVFQPRAARAQPRGSAP
jgi:DNA repair protein RecO (recombination protein O)